MPQSIYDPSQVVLDPYQAAMPPLRPTAWQGQPPAPQDLQAPQDSLPPEMGQGLPPEMPVQVSSAVQPQVNAAPQSAVPAGAPNPAPYPEQLPPEAYRQSDIVPQPPLPNYDPVTQADANMAKTWAARPTEEQHKPGFWRTLASSLAGGAIAFGGKGTPQADALGMKTIQAGMDEPYQKALDVWKPQEAQAIESAKEAREAYGVGQKQWQDQTEAGYRQSQESRLAAESRQGDFNQFLNAEKLKETERKDDAYRSRLDSQNADQNRRLDQGDRRLDQTEKNNEARNQYNEDRLARQGQLTPGQVTARKDAAAVRMSQGLAKLKALTTSTPRTVTNKDGSTYETTDWLWKDGSAVDPDDYTQKEQQIRNTYEQELGNADQSIQHEDVSSWPGQGGKQAPMTAPGSGITIAGQPPPYAIAKLKEGEPHTFTNGQVWTLKNNKPVMLSRGK
jgi:hypothetical protein